MPENKSLLKSKEQKIIVISLRIKIVNLKI